MAYQKFETENAEYTLYSGAHTRSSYHMIKESGGLESLDVLVMEYSGYRIDEMSELLDFLQNSQYKEIFENIPEENPELKVYLCDAESTNLGEFMCMVKHLLTFPIFFPLASARLFNGLSSKEESGISANICSLYGLIFPMPMVGVRDAITARSIEEHIVPKETVRGKKPKVGILYGASHSGIKTQIRHKKLRDTILSMYKMCGYPGIDSENYHITRATNCSTDNAIISVEDVEL